ncbi:uncharacterized protein LOC125230612 isoform X1 [Leguminivora glycinivorella]|uniref:uncharacterized protein LOC125230612 isoform X1 n=1 Tax=Leguminivora glycinivorella TaxID=1035111 RepID=UPI00200EED19|nr:uncharacterized protein LOC125230612 isoform X1 [Leguminivora glycinivorella]
MWFTLILLLPKINYAVERDCANISCDHNNVKVCGVHTNEYKVVSFRLFEDKCAMQKFECETGMKGFKPTRMEHCKKVLSLNYRRNSNFVQNNTAEEQEAQIEGIVSSNTNTEFDIKDTTHSYEHSTCIQCDCNAKPDPLCAIRAKKARFIIRWFHDKCHMLQYNCENKLNFTETDDYICVGNKKYQKLKHDLSKVTVKTTAVTDHMEVIETNKPDLENQSCIQHECISDERTVCAIRAEAERFIIRWFNDTCHMLQYNCEKKVEFNVTEDFLCNGDKDFTDEGDEDVIEYNDIISQVENNTQLLEEAEQLEYVEATTYEESYKTEDVDEENLLPSNIVVSTYNINDDINKTVHEFFAATHKTGIEMEEIGIEDARRMLVKYTGPLNFFKPRAFVPANYTPIEDMDDSEYHEYYPLAKFCYHKCPKKCPDFYRPVCGARIDNKKQTPFLFYPNHCYMDKAKCNMYWNDYKGTNLTEIEEMGFIFCGGFKVMNMYYMYPIIRLLQRMGRIKKKGKAHFVMRNLGSFPFHLQGK